MRRSNVCVCVCASWQKYFSVNHFQEFLLFFEGVDLIQNRVIKTSQNKLITFQRNWGFTFLKKFVEI